MTVGKYISLVQYGNEIIRRVLVAVENEYIYVCKREEWDLSRRENREPTCIGFRSEYVVNPGRMNA